MTWGSETVATSERQRVYILARKRLVSNTRIFKQADTLASNGYEVVVIGICGVADSCEEYRGGYRLVRLAITPPHAKLLRGLRRSRATIARTVRRCSRLALVVGRRIANAVCGPPREWRDPASSLTAVPPGVRRWLARITAIVAGRTGRSSRSRVHHLLLQPLGVLWVLPRRAGEALHRAERSVLRHVQWPSRSWAYYRAVYRLFQDPELPAPTVIQANDLDTLLVAVLIARRRCLPIVYDAQELYTGIHTLPRWYTWVLRVQEFILIRFVDRVIVVNDAISDVMERRYRKPTDAVVLNCPPYQPMSGLAAVPSLRERTGLPVNLRVLVYSGGLSPNRGLENVILSLRELPGCALIVIGEGALRSKLIEIGERAGVSQRVRYLEPVPHQEVPRLLASADLGVVPYENVGLNHYLSSPSKLFHYMMAELPVACSDFPFLRRVVIDNGIGCVFDPSSPSSIARAIRTFLEAPSASEEARQRLALVKGSYSWETHGKRFVDIFRTL